MLDVLFMITAAMAVISGMVAMWLGEWKHFPLKFAGLSFSVATSGYIFVVCVSQIYSIFPANDLPTCTISIYNIFRNLAFVIFHISTCQDVLREAESDGRKFEHSNFNGRFERSSRSQSRRSI